MACRHFDAQVVHSKVDSPRGQLLSQFVCARIKDMTGIDIGLFSFDGHNALYYFAMNADEQIYLRYGGRDATGPDAYLNTDSFDLAMELGLEQHRKYQAGELEPQPRPEPSFPRDIPLLNEHIVQWGRCVECHIISDYRLQEQERSGPSDRVQTMFVYPDIRRLGIHLDVPRGLVVERASDAALAAGLQAEDCITALEGTPVLTFGDLQHALNKVDRKATQLQLTVRRADQPVVLELALGQEWWWTDLYDRYWSVEPLVYFKNRPLAGAEKEALGLDPEGFASEVTEVQVTARALNVHELEVGDIIFEVDGETRSELTQSCHLFIKLTKVAGSVIEVKLLREGKELTMQIDSEKLNFRKESQ